MSQCGSLGGKLIGGAGQQLKRIKELRFPSALEAYAHLELQAPVRLSGPRAALVQTQLEELAGKPFGGSRGPERRRSVKSPDLRLQEFPMAAPEALSCRMRVLEAYGLTEQSLAVLVALEKEVLQAKADRRAEVQSGARNHLAAPEEEEYDDYDDL